MQSSAQAKINNGTKESAGFLFGRLKKLTEQCTLSKKERKTLEDTF